MPLGDPFAFDTTDPNAPGMLGQTPQFWHDLASFGGNLSAAANARTGDGHLANGTSFAGALGPAITATMDQGRQNAISRSQLASQQATTQNQLLQNQATSLGLPLLKAQTEMQLGFLNGMPGIAKSLQGGTQGGGTQGGGPDAPASDYATAIIGKEGGGRSQTSSAAGVGQFTYQPDGSGTWNQFAKENPQYFQGMTSDQVAQARFDPKMGARATDWLASKNVAPLQSAGVSPTGQALGIAHYLGPQAAGAIMKADPAAPVTDVLTQSIGPDHTRAYVQANPKLAAQTVSGLRNEYAGIPNLNFGGGGKEAPAGGQTASSADDLASNYEQQSATLTARATRIEALQNLAQNLHIPWPAMAQQYRIPLTDDPAVLRSNAEKANAAAIELRTAGPTAKSKAMNSNWEARQGGMVGTFDNNGNRIVIKNPQYEETQDAQGNTIPMHVVPPEPGSPEGTPGRASPILGPNGKPIVTKLPQNVQEARDKAYTDFSGKDTDSYIAAQNAHTWLEQMDHSADVLNQNGGFMGTGPTAPERLAFANNVNDILRTSGLPSVFDPSQISAWEELKKATITAGFELASHYEGHARQAASTIMNATLAIPSAANTPIGFKLVSNGIKESAQQAIDLHEFKQNVYNNNGDLVKAEVDFYKQNPPQAYARRAISAADPAKTPYSVASDDQLSRFLPGTYVKYKDRVVQVPERQGAPSIPYYMKPIPTQTVNP
jgi:hypothetical protein